MSITVNAQVVGLDRSVQQIVDKINRRGGIKLNVNDRNFTQPLGRITNSANEFTKSLEASNARVIAFGASVGIINGVQDAFKNLITSVVKVEKALTDVNVVLNTSDANLRKFGDGLFKVARNTAQSFDSVASAATEFARQGLGIEETLKRTNDALILTRLTGMDAADSVKNLTAAMNTFASAGLTSSQIISKMASVDVEFAVSADDLAAAISRTGQAAISAGVSIDELIGVVTAAQQKTARGGAVIGNSLKTIFTRIQRPDTLNQLEQLGVAVRDVEYNTLPAIQILNNLAKTYDTLSGSQKSQIGQTVAGVFQINILKAALADASSQNSILSRATEISSNATDEAIQKNTQLNTTLSALASQASIRLLELSKSIGEIALAPGIKSVLNFVNGLAQGITNLTNGDDVGSQFFQGFLKGVGKIASGPGLILFIGIVVKLFANAVKFASQSIKEILGITTQAGKLKAIEEAIVGVLSKNGVIQAELLKLEGNRAAQERVVLELIKQQTLAMTSQQNLARNLAPGLGGAGVRPNLTMPVRRSEGGPIRRYNRGGHVPNFALQSPRIARQIDTGNILQGPDSGLQKRLATHHMQFGANGSVHWVRRGKEAKSDAKSIRQKVNTSLGKEDINKPLDATALGMYMITPRMGGQPKAVTKKAGKGKPYVKFLTTGLRTKAFKGGSGQNLKENRAGFLENSIEKNIHSSTKKYIDTIQPKTVVRPVTTESIAQGFKKTPGAKGAMKAAIGSAFEVGLTSALDYKSAQREVGGDFDIRGGENLKDLQTLINQVPYNPLRLGDFKVSDSSHSHQSMASKIWKEAKAGLVFDKSNLGSSGTINEAGKIARSNDPTWGRRGVKKSGITKLGKGGGVPNFSPLGDAISREMAAGVPPSAIRVGSSSSLSSSMNPGGLGVFNTIDEPMGLGQGISRSISEGRNPSTYGMPNFARGADSITPFMARGPELYKEFQGADVAEQKANNRRYNKAMAILAKSFEDGHVSQRTLIREQKKLGNQYVKTTSTQMHLETNTRQAAQQMRPSAIGGMRNRFSRHRARVMERQSTRGGMGMMMAPMAAGMLAGGIEQLGTNKETGLVNKGASGASGLLGGAAAGAMIGSMILPGWGTAIGAAVGGLGGLVSGLKKAGKAAEEYAKSQQEARVSEKKAIFQQGLQGLLSTGNPLAATPELSQEISRLLNQKNEHGQFRLENYTGALRLLESAGAIAPNAKFTQTETIEKGKLKGQTKTTTTTIQSLINSVTEGGSDHQDNMTNIRSLLVTAAAAMSNAGQNASKQAKLFAVKVPMLMDVATMAFESAIKELDRKSASIISDLKRQGESKLLTLSGGMTIGRSASFQTQGLRSATADKISTIDDAGEKQAREFLKKLASDDNAKLIPAEYRALTLPGIIGGEGSSQDKVNQVMSDMGFVSSGASMKTLTQAASVGAGHKVTPGMIDKLTLERQGQAQDKALREKQIENLKKQTTLQEQNINQEAGAKILNLKNAAASSNILKLNQLRSESLLENARIQSEINNAERESRDQIIAQSLGLSETSQLRAQNASELQSFAESINIKSQELDSTNASSLLGLSSGLQAESLSKFNERLDTMQNNLAPGESITASMAKSLFANLHFQQKQEESLSNMVGQQQLSVQLQNGINGQKEAQLRAAQASAIKEVEYSKTIEHGRGRAMTQIKNEIESFGDTIGNTTTTSFLSNLERGLDSVATGAKNAREAFAAFGIGIIQDIQKILQKNIANRLTSALFGSGIGQGIQSGIGSVFQAKSEGGPIRKYAKGGGVPAIVQGGEFLFNKRSASRIGSDNLNALNSLSVPKFASGGSLSARLLSSPDPEMAAIFGLRERKDQQDRDYKRALANWRKQRRTAIISTIANTFISAGLSELNVGGAKFQGDFGAGQTKINGGVGQVLPASVEPDMWARGSMSAAGGGMIRGGSGVRDDIPTTLQGGEFVMRKSAVQKYGSSFMDRLNSGMNEGGLVGQGQTTQIPTESTASNNISINITMNNGESESEGTDVFSGSNSSTKNKDFAQKVKSVVMGVIKEEQRVGGTLSKKNPDQ